MNYSNSQRAGVILYLTALILGAYIESFNKQIKKYSHRKEQFQNEESMERFLVSSFDTYNQKFLGRSHKGFQQAEGELEQMLSQLIEN